jgi:hypothetical protein
MSKLNITLLAAMGLSISAIVGCSKTSSSKAGTPASTDSVLYSNWIPLHLVLTGVSADSDYEQKITASALTANILNKGLVTIFANETGSGGEYVNYISDFSIYPTFAPGFILLDAYGTYGYEISMNRVVDSVRYIILPGMISTTSSSGSLHSYTSAELLQMDYSTLTKTLNIPAHGSSIPPTP